MLRSFRQSRFAFLSQKQCFNSPLQVQLLRQAHCVSPMDVVTAEENLRKLGIDITPVMTSTTMNTISGHELFFKCELFQKTGSFKVRGATNACANLPDEKKVVVTHSSGNHAQALAFAAKASGRKAVVVMPNISPQVKVEATKAYGAEVILCDVKDRVKEAERIVKELDAEFISPCEHPDVIAGQGTIVHELMKQVQDSLDNGRYVSSIEQLDRDYGCNPPLDAIIVPVSGGGLLSGTAFFCKRRWPGVLVIGAEPLTMDDASRSLKLGSIQTNDPNAYKNTIADGLRLQLGSNTFPIVYEFVDDIITVKEDDIISATSLIWSRMKLQIEPSSAVAVAVACSQEFRDIMKKKLQKRCQNYRPARVGVILTGGNVDLKTLGPILADAKAYPSGSIL